MSKRNPLIELQNCGQSFWYDNVSRSLIESGAIKKMIDEDGLRGLTSNPTIFDKGISGSKDYDTQFRRLVSEQKSPDDIYQSLVVKDIQDCADLFRPLYDQTKRGDGFVSLEVRPDLAHDTDGTIREARALWKTVDRPNLMVKVPATKEGLPAITQLIAEGISINVTLIFSVERYQDVAEAYIHGLEQRQEQGYAVSDVASVASFFVSRLDSLVDQKLEALLEKETDAKKIEQINSLMHQAAIANAKVAYARYQTIFEGTAFARLKSKGALEQRVLWASTSTKNPTLRDVLYVEELIGSQTVNTMPPATIDAFRDHGRVTQTLNQGHKDAQAVLDRLSDVGLSYTTITDELECAGVASFQKSFDQLMEGIAQKRDLFLEVIS